MTDGLRTKATRGTAWLASQSLVSIALGIVRLAVLARLLAPVDFGVVALALVAVGGLEGFTNFGARHNVVQRNELTSNFLANIFTFSILRGLLLTLLLLPFMQWYATTIDAHHGALILSIVALLPAVRGLMNPRRLIAERHAAFGRIVLFEVGTSLFDFALTLALAFYFRDARALALGLLSAEALRSLASYAVFGRSPRPAWNGQLQREILNVGRHFLVMAIGTFLLMRGSHFVAGHMGTAALVGVYVLAYRLANMPIRLVLATIRRVAFPVLSRIQDDRARLRAAFLEMLDIQLFVYVTAMVGLNVFATPLVFLLYGPKWAEVIPVLHALTLLMAGRGLANIVSPYVLAVGAFSFASRTQILGALLLLLTAPAGMGLFGLPGLAIGVGIPYAAISLARAFYCMRDAQIPYPRLARLTWLALMPNLPAAAVALLVLWSMPRVSLPWTLAAAMGFAGSHLLAAWFLRPDLARRLLLLVRRRPKEAPELSQ